jgi:4-amino-4-deoxy-L-arabinose transferase-like glycosyltransferase
MASLEQNLTESLRSSGAGWVLSASAAATIFACLALLGIELRPLLPVDETRYLAVAWEMWRDQNHLIPHLNGAVYSQKPPLLFWLINLAWSLGGVSEFSARLISPLFAAASLLLTGALARRLWPEEPKVAALAPWVLGGSGLFLVYGSVTMFDSMLTAATLAALLALLAAHRNPSVLSWAALGMSLAVGVLAKGPAIVVHVLPLALLMPLWSDAEARQGFLRWCLGLALAFGFAGLLVGCWFLPAVLQQGGGYLDAVVWNQGAGRIVSSFAHEKPFWYFIALTPLFLWPWGWARRSLKALDLRGLWREEAGRFLLLWIALPFVIHSVISGKQLHYLLPELPALALLFARAAFSDEERPRRWRLLPIAPFCLAALFAWALPLGLLPSLAERVTHVGFANAALATTGMLLLAVLVLSLRNAKAAYALMAPACLLVFYALATPNLQATQNAKPLGEALNAYDAKGIAFVGENYNGEFTFAGRLTHPMATLSSEQELEQWMAAHPGGAVIAKAGRPGPQWEPLKNFPFRGASYRLWRVPEG